MITGVLCGLAKHSEHDVGISCCVPHSSRVSLARDPSGVEMPEPEIALRPRLP